MPINKLGYACINICLKNSKPTITTNRKINLSTFKKPGGLEKLSSIILQNAKDLYKILQWNQRNFIKFYRMSGDIMVLKNHYEMEDLPDFEEISKWLSKCGSFAKQNNHRLTFSPGPFNVLASERSKVVKSTIREFTMLAKIMDIMGLERSPYNKINTQVWASYGDKKATLKRFRENFLHLPKSVTSRLTIENEFKPSLYNLEEIYEHIHEPLGLPIVLDYLSFEYVPTNHSLTTAVDLACSTWKGIIPVVHYSEAVPKSESQRRNTHSYFVVNSIPTFDRELDVMIEAKGKEQALLSYRNKHDQNQKR